MQESNLEKLKAEGWNKMHSILDKEMPQKKKNRRFPFFWLLLGILLGIGTFYVYNKLSNHNESDKISVDKSQAIATINEVNQLNDTNTNSAQEINNSISNFVNYNNSPKASNNNTNVFPDSNQLAVNYSSKSKYLLNNRIRKNIRNNRTDNNNSISNSAALSDKKFINSNAVHTSANTPINIYNNTTSSQINLVNKGEETIHESGPTLSQINLKLTDNSIIQLENLSSNIQLLNINYEPNIIQQKLKTKSNKLTPLKNKLPYSIMLASGIHLNSWTKHLSYDIGMVQQLHFLKKFSITLGTEYEYSKSSNDLINCSIIHFPENNMLLKNDGLDKFSLPENSSDPNYRKLFVDEKSARWVNSIQSLNFPLRLNYHINSKLLFGLGTEFSILLNKNAIKLDSFPYSCLINAKTSNFDYIRIRNKEFRYSAGIAYKLNNRFNLNLDASYYKDRYDYTKIQIPSNSGTPWPLSDINYKRNFFNVGLGMQYRIF